MINNYQRLIPVMNLNYWPKTVSPTASALQGSRDAPAATGLLDAKNSNFRTFNHKTAVLFSLCVLKYRICLFNTDFWQSILLLGLGTLKVV